MLPTSVSTPQPREIDQLWVSLTGMLGIGIPSYENVKGVDTKELGSKK